jgi:transcriptional regulator with XRE-family HTH domain
MELIIRIRELRLKKGLTQKDLGEMVGVSHVHVSQLERGIKNLNNHLLQRFAAALEVEPSDLILSETDDEIQRLSKSLRVLSPEDRERVEAFVSALLRSQRDSQKS